MTPREMCFIGFSIPTLTHKAASGLSQPSANYPFLCTQYWQSLPVSLTVLTNLGLINTANKYEVHADIGKCKIVYG